MKKHLFLVGITLLIFGLAGGEAFAQQTGATGTASPPAPTSPSAPKPPLAPMSPRGGATGWYCPWCGADFSPGGPGLKQYYGVCPRPGHYGVCPQTGAMPGRTKDSRPISMEQAEFLLDNYVRSTNNPNLKLGKILDEKDTYVGEITTKDGALVDKIEVDKSTGFFRSAYASRSISMEQAKFLLDNYIRSTNNPNLKLGKILDEKDTYVGEITTKDGALVDKIVVDKSTGHFRSAYGQ